MINLDDAEKIKQLDKSNLYGSVEEFYKQFIHAWDDTKNITLPPSYRQVNKLLLTGMGGSGLGARLIESLYGLTLKYPLVRLNNYDLPTWVDENTLVICSSFSGTTEEVIENAHQAQARGAKWMTISTGNTLDDLAIKYNVPHYRIVPTYNPSNQPRMAVGYSIVGQLVMASKTGLFNFTETDLNQIVNYLKTMIGNLQLSVPTEKNTAKQTAKTLFGKKVVFVAARHLIAAAHVAKNQMNENAKNFSAIFEIPELNHHLMEGLQYPTSNQQDLIFVFVKSKLYPELIQKRFEITEDVVKQNKVQTLNWTAESGDVLTQAFEFIQFFAYVNFYLSMLNNLDPAPIPWVDYFKIKLGQPLGK